MEEKEHVLNILKEALATLNKEDGSRIKSLSDKMIHRSSIDQDPDVISVAVIIYALSKIIERKSYRSERNWDKFYNGFLDNIIDMIQALEKNDFDRFRMEVKTNRELIQNLSGRLKDYIQDVFRKASINKASKIYEHGISMEKTAKILGISLWELAEYAGQKYSEDYNLTVTMPIESRIKIAEEVFG